MNIKLRIVICFMVVMSFLIGVTGAFAGGIVTEYFFQRLDPVCQFQQYDSFTVFTFGTVQTSCLHSESIQMKFKGSKDLFMAYLPNGGFAEDTLIVGDAPAAGISNGIWIRLLESTPVAEVIVSLVEVDPSDGSIISILDTMTRQFDPAGHVVIRDTSELSGVVHPGNTYGFLVSAYVSARRTITANVMNGDIYTDIAAAEGCY